MKRLLTIAVYVFAFIGFVGMAAAAYQYTVEANGSVLWRGRSKIQSTADQKVRICNNAGTKCLFIDVAANGEPAFYAANGTTKATGTWQHMASVSESITGTSTVGLLSYAAATLCTNLPATGTAKHVYFVSDAGAGNVAGLCVPDPTGWLLADGSAACCP